MLLVWRAVSMALGLASAGIAVLCALAWYWRYWLWRDCFNELGRCWDSASEQVYVEQAGLIWGGGAIVFLLLALVLCGLAMNRR